MILALFVFVLGAVGALLRVLLGHKLPPLAGTLAINLGAAFLLGLSTAWSGVLADGFRIGLLGAASTWSTLANEMAILLRGRKIPRAVVYLVVSLSLGVGSAWLGLQLAESLGSG